jgi:hypothetical protein
MIIKLFIINIYTVIKARCVMPLMYFNGAINIWVSTDGGRTFSWSAGFNVGNFAFVAIFSLISLLGKNKTKP